LHKNHQGKLKENKYANWASESDIMSVELKESLKLFKIISKEILDE